MLTQPRSTTRIRRDLAGVVKDFQDHSLKGLKRQPLDTQGAKIPLDTVAGTFVALEYDEKPGIDLAMKQPGVVTLGEDTFLYSQEEQTHSSVFMDGENSFAQTRVTMAKDDEIERAQLFVAEKWPEGPDGYQFTGYDVRRVEGTQSEYSGFAVDGLYFPDHGLIVGLPL